MVCRLVKQKKVKFAEHKLKQSDPCSFAAGAVFKHLIHIVALEQKCGKCVSYCSFGHCREVRPNLIKCGFIKVELFLHLVKITRLHH